MREVARCARGIGLVLVAALLACQSTFYDEYRAEHPDFDPVLPRIDATLAELLAALHAPNPYERITVELSELAIFEVAPDGWVEIPFARIRSGETLAGDDRSYAVLVFWTCTLDQGLRQSRNRRAGSYLLPGNRLTAYDHYAFRNECSASNEFRAARGDLIPVERQAFARVSGPGATFSLGQAYQRGLAYVEAGRLTEARAMLVMGERSYRPAAKKLRESGRADALRDVQRLRAALMRALGLEEKPEAN